MRPEQLKYEQEQEPLPDSYNSYSKTDPNATFMRMKENDMMETKKAKFNREGIKIKRGCLKVDLRYPP